MLARVKALLFSRTATSAIEFALLAPVYFALVFGTLEIALVSWFSTLAAGGGEQAAAYMRERRLAGEPITEIGLRDSVCSSVRVGGLSCDATKLKIGTFYAGEPVGGRFDVPAIIENRSDPKLDSGGQFIVAVGYNWSGMGLPTSRIVLPTGSDGPQIQARTYTVLAEHVWDNGVTK